MTDEDRDLDEKYKKAVVFIDSLGEGDLEHMPWLRENLNVGRMDAGPVYVTPVVLGSIYTGKQPTDHGMPSVSRYDQPSRLRPNGATIPEIAAADEQYDSVMQMGLPFIVPPDVEPEGNYWHLSEAMGQQATLPEQAGLMNLPGPAGSINKPGENLDLAFNLRVDHTMMTFGLARNLMETWQTDVAFISYRVPDSYCHYHYPEPEDDDQTYRQGILEQIDSELQYLHNQADLFVFGDHGARDLTDVFRLNRWLIENGYLEVDIDHEWREKSIEYGMVDTDEDVPGEVILATAPEVTIDEENSVAIGADPFSTGVTLLEGATETAVSDLISELSDHEHIKSVRWTRTLYGDGELLEECPDLYALRKPGVFVSGNLHPEPGGPEITRSGVHHRIGHYATPDGIKPPSKNITPQDLFSLIAEDFLDLDTDAAGDVGDGDAAATVDSDDRDVQQFLEDMGYM